MARKRIDPKSTAPDGGAANPERLLKRDPSRYYVWVNPNDDDTGCQSYLADGFRMEEKVEGGVIAPRGSTKDDNVWTLKGQKLMSCPLEERQDRDSAGQAVSDSVDRRILKQGNIEDGLRGRGYRLGVDGSQTTAPFVETENGA